jgi:hypothetical protein
LKRLQLQGNDVPLQVIVTPLLSVEGIIGRKNAAAIATTTTRITTLTRRLNVVEMMPVGFTPTYQNGAMRDSSE